MKKKNTFALALLATVALASCSSSKNAQKGPNMDKEDFTISRADDNLDPGFLILSDAQRNVVKKNNVFALNLFRQVSGFDSKVISPLSVAYLMGMLANGADGNTQQEILKAIGCEGVSVKELNELYKGMLNIAGKADESTVMNIANYVAVNKNYKLNPEYEKTVRDAYQAGVENLDFSSSKTTTRINNWCSEHTDGMIKKLVDQVEPSAVSYIMNAIYFNGTWKSKFEPQLTKEENFRGYTRDIQKVRMMRQKDDFCYMQNDMFKAVELPYGNGTYNMTILLPNEDKSIADMLASLDAESLSSLSNKMDLCTVDLKLPKFTTEMELSLNDIIRKLGAPSMFNPSTADFSKFANGDFYVSKMVQKAKIEVSEQGTKAAAVTAAVMLMAMAPTEKPHVSFYANRPFVYLITDNMSGAILFMGQYTGNH